MAKALKVVGTVVAVVGLAATGIGLAVGAAGFLGMGAATWATIGTVATLTAAGIGVATSAFAPKPSFSREGNPLQFQTNPQSGLPYPIGRTRMSGLRIHADTYDATAYKSEGKQDALSFAVMLGAGGPMDAIETFRADKEVVSFNASTGMAVGKYAGWMAQKVSLGLAGASALALSFGGGGVPGWTAQHKLSGISHALWTLRFDQEGERFGAGVPEPEWVGRWVKAYDPRKDSTYPGGSGSHRAGDEITYQWSRNPALHALTWCLGRWQNGKRTLGIGAPVTNIRVSDFVEAANIADANGWHCGGVEWSTDSKWSILKRMLQAGGAEPTMTGAMIGCRVNTPRISVATIEEGHLLDSLSYASTRSRRDRFNTVIPRYRSEAHEWEIISGSPVSVADYVTEDGGPRTKEIDFPLVQHETGQAGVDGNRQAGELAAYEIVNSREAGPIRFTVGPQFIGVKTGDVVTLNSPDDGLDAQPVLIRSRSVDPATFKITFEAETETDAKHDFALGRTTVPPATWEPTPPDLTPPQPSAALWSLGAGHVGAGYPALFIAGACEFPGADSVLVEHRAVGAAEWTTHGPQEASVPVNLIVSPVEGETEYEARIAYKSGDRVGEWLLLAPVTTPADAVGTGLRAFLTNPSQQLPVAPDGTVTAHIGIRGGKFQVYSGGQEVTEGVTFEAVSQSGGTFSIDPVTGVYQVSAITGEVATFTMKASVGGGELFATYTVQPIAGADGGEYIWIGSVQNSAVSYNEDGEPEPPNQTISFNAQLSAGIDPSSVTWQLWRVNSDGSETPVNWQSGPLAQVISDRPMRSFFWLSAGQFDEVVGAHQGVKARVSYTLGGTTYEDTGFAYRVQDGQPGASPFAIEIIGSRIVMAYDKDGELK